jgi:hypothetical protein
MDILEALTRIRSSHATHTTACASTESAGTVSGTNYKIRIYMSGPFAYRG